MLYWKQSNRAKLQQRITSGHAAQAPAPNAQAGALQQRPGQGAMVPPQGDRRAGVAGGDGLLLSKGPQVNDIE